MTRFTFRSKCCFLCSWKAAEEQHNSSLKIICTHYYCKLLTTLTAGSYIQQSFIIKAALTWLTEVSLWLPVTSLPSAHFIHRNRNNSSDLLILAKTPLPVFIISISGFYKMFPSILRKSKIFLLQTFNDYMNKYIRTMLWLFLVDVSLLTLVISKPGNSGVDYL